MPRPTDLHHLLRTGTRQDHAQIDQLLSTLDLQSPTDYGRFLNIHAEALTQLAGHTPATDRADMAALLRCLQSDLGNYETGRVIDFAPAEHEPLGRQLGVSYVIRGSRLGAQVLIRRLAAVAPRAYLAWQPAMSWPDFLLRLEAFSRTQPPACAQQVLEGARWAFGVFLRVAQPATELAS
jgi:heme oxygenase